MRIAFDPQIFGWQEYGGISRYFYELARELAVNCGQEVAVFSPLYVNRYLAGAPTELRVVGRPAPCLPKSGRVYRTLNSLLAAPLLRRYQPEILHETYYAAKGLAPRGARVVLTVFDMIHERFSENFSALDPNSREKALAVARADQVICISEQTRRDLVELLGVDPGKISVVHLGFSLTCAAKQRLPLPPRPFLLYVGKRGGYKNFAALLAAFAASPVLLASFDLLCFGGGALTTAERKIMARLGLPAERVRQVGGDDAVLAALYQSAAALVFPSLYEGFGIPPLEAMSFDCPVIASGVSSIPEVVGDAAEIFDPRDVDALRLAMERVVGNESLRLSLIARGRERIKLFSWNRCARETLEVYKRVLNQG